MAANRWQQPRLINAERPIQNEDAGFCVYALEAPASLALTKSIARQFWERLQYPAPRVRRWLARSQGVTHVLLVCSQYRDARARFAFYYVETF